ncbi:tRNA (guanosine(37)-N1)-methyltransferase TrmD [Haloimpatiens sp. FM7315]|uniref:tRNA (guanosine(37)-N1)-methyltransferase TrmD n=1 Tax=Haloimpatiens sp. FM7315 TaxID=3298609 RepID=UPI003977CB50
MNIDILTLFPEMFDVFKYSIIGRAMDKNIISIRTHNIRDYSKNKHKKVDDYPYGGGAGMLMTPEPIVEAIKKVKEINRGKIVYLGPRGRKYCHNLALELSKEENLVFLCGHYEGIDERVYDYIDLEISIGDFVLTGGEMACIPIIDSLARLTPGVLSSSESFMEESFYNGLLEYPQYTRPECFEGKTVPKVLLSGHHENIRKWRKEESLRITKDRRPDLYSKYLNKQNNDEKKQKK